MNKFISNIIKKYFINESIDFDEMDNDDEIVSSVDITQLLLDQLLSFDENDLLSPDEIKSIYHSYTVKTKTELKWLIEKTVKYYGDECDLNWIDTSLITDMSKLFKSIRFNGDITKWDVSSVENMSEMFCNAPSFNQPIGDWDVSSVKDMAYMFFKAISFNQPIGSWDVSSVQRINFMFYGAPSFNQPIGNWDVSSVKDMDYMFNGALLFNQPICNWDVSSVNTMYGMFDNCPIREEYKPKFN